jgi:hypothetical protein
MTERNQPNASTADDDCRNAFEIWTKEQQPHLSLLKNEHGDYLYGDTALAWRVWSYLYPAEVGE